MKYIVVIPTYKEIAKVKSIFKCFSKVCDQSIRVIIVNANPGDETSSFLSSQSSDNRFIELKGSHSLFWSGLVNIGLKYVMESISKPDYVVIMNVDITFEGNLFLMIHNAIEKLGAAQIGALCHNGSNAVSSGTILRSWMFALTRHPYAGLKIEDVPKEEYLPVEYLPARCTVIPVKALIGGGLIEERLLPHYAADNEYTLRLKRLGYQPYIATNIQIQCDMENTGNSIYHKNPSLFSRIKNITSIKSAYNPAVRYRFVCMAYPFYARPTALFIYGLKGVVEVLFGGNVIRCLFGSLNRGFSGSKSN